MAWAGLLVALTTPPERRSEHKGEVVACPGPLCPGGHLRQPCVLRATTPAIWDSTARLRASRFLQGSVPVPSPASAESWGPPGPPGPSGVTLVLPQCLPEPPQTWQEHKGILLKSRTPRVCLAAEFSEEILTRTWHVGGLPASVNSFYKDIPAERRPPVSSWEDKPGCQGSRSCEGSVQAFRSHSGGPCVQKALSLPAVPGAPTSRGLVIQQTPCATRIGQRSHAGVKEAIWRFNRLLG